MDTRLTKFNEITYIEVLKRVLNNQVNFEDRIKLDSKLRLQIECDLADAMLSGGITLEEMYYQLKLFFDI